LYTRRVFERRYFLRPSAKLNHAVRFLLALGSERYGMKIIAVVFLSNHYHMVLQDEPGQYPRFFQWFNCLVGRAANDLLGRSDHFWSQKKGSDVTVLRGPQRVVEEAAYVLNNPVAAGAVSAGEDWPGVRSRPLACMTDGETVKRPTWVFREGGLPDEATLRLHVPSTHADLSAEAFGQLLAQEVSEGESAIREERAEQDLGFQGPKACLAMSWRHCPDAPEASGPGTAPAEIIGDDPESTQQLQEELDAFREAYETTRRRWVAGERDLKWPEGTWKMTRTHGCPGPAPP